VQSALNAQREQFRPFARTVKRLICASRENRYFRRIEQPLHCARRICIVSFAYTCGEQISASGIYLNFWAFYICVSGVYICIHMRISLLRMYLDAEPLPPARVHCIIQFWSLAIKKRNKGRTIALASRHMDRGGHVRYFSHQELFIRPRTWMQYWCMRIGDDILARVSFPSNDAYVSDKIWNSEGDAEQESTFAALEFTQLILQNIRLTALNLFEKEEPRLRAVLIAWSYI